MNSETKDYPIVTIGIPVMPEREYYLDQCLRSVLNQTYSKLYEVIIAQHPGFRYQLKSLLLPENILLKFIDSGNALSTKRNDIIVYSTGKYIINIDDDVIPEPNWLENMIKAAIENDYDVFWGPAKPLYEKEFPDSLDAFEMLIGGFHYDRKGVLRRKGLIGCNFGFKKGLNHKRGKFLESVGRGAIIEDGEETLFLAECINPRMGIVMDGVVNHFVQPERINFKYIVKNRCSNVKATILINHMLGSNNIPFLIDRFKYFIRAFRPKKNMLKTIVLEYQLTKTTILTFLTVILKKVK